MTLPFITYRPFPLVNPPRIHTDLLWDLGILFGGITAVYFLVILILRYRITQRRRTIYSRKKELAPMITNFLFFSGDSDATDQHAYIRMKIEIRELLKLQINREILAGVLIDLRQDVTGSARHRLLGLYQDLGLHQGAFRKLNSRRWEKVSQGIHELTDMQVGQAYHILKKLINNRRSVIRKQAQLAVVNLREEGIRYVLDTARHPISEWQQLKLMELLKHKEGFVPPRFRDWLISENKDVVLFALRLIRHYRQNDAEKAIITLLQHRSTEIKSAALECIREFRFHQARNSLRQHFGKATPELKILILDALQEIALPEDLSWLQALPAKDPSFLVRSKAGTVINSLKPDTVLPTKDILPLDEGNEPVGGEETSEGSDAPRHVPNKQPAMSGNKTVRDLLAMEFLTADFENIQLDLSWDPHWYTPGESNPEVPAVDAESLPREDWSQEHERIFAHCFLEELKEILSMRPGSVSLPDASMDFIPVVIEKTEKPNVMEPHQPTPDWLLELEVHAEILSADSGYARVLREILLEDLAENEQVFSTDFIPWVTKASQTGPTDSEEAPEALEMNPDFGVMADGIQQVDGPSGMDGQPEQTEPQGGEPEGDMNYFSIFREFFRSYDRESKLILLDEIPEIGTEKELHFLEELFEDPDAQVAKKARQVYALLAKRLDIAPDALINKGSRTLWTPPSSKEKHTSQEKSKKINPDPAFGDATPEEVFGFIPEFSPPLKDKEPRKNQVTHKMRKRNNRLFRFLRGNQNSSNE
ncbi:MAG: HEAT repeat domain-containing protein [Flavobacteriaceae bacterium]|nr:MAG: HEAT repeat domain-containing protein [Flavobacteriaceae bacterium]